MSCPTRRQSCERCGWIASSEMAEVITAVNRTDDATIGSPPPLLFFKSLADESSCCSPHIVALCRCAHCAPYTSESVTDTRTSRSECARLSLPSERTAERELDEGRRANDKSRIQHIKRPVKAMKEIDIDPPKLGVVSPGNASLWEFLLELLANPMYEPYIRWRNRERGLFKIHNSEVVAALWGKHKHRSNMNFDKMARAMRYYYGKNILDKGAEGGRLEYEFRSGSNWLEYVPRSIKNDTNNQQSDVSNWGASVKQGLTKRKRRRYWNSSHQR